MVFFEIYWNGSTAFTRGLSMRVWNIIAFYGHELSGFPFLDSREFKSISTFLLVISFKHRTNFLRDQKFARVSLVRRNFQGKCSDELTSLDPPVLKLSGKTRYATHIVANYAHSLCIHLVICFVEKIPKFIQVPRSLKS